MRRKELNSEKEAKKLKKISIKYAKRYKLIKM